MSVWSRVACARRIRAALGLPAVAAVLLLAAGSAHAASVAPEVRIHENTTCADIGPQLTQLKVESPLEGTHALADGTLSGSYTIDGKRLRWTSDTVGVAHVLVKGGADTNAYAYRASHGDTGLFAPVNASGGPAGISHFTFCYSEQAPQRPSSPPVVLPPGRVIPPAGPANTTTVPPRAAPAASAASAGRAPAGAVASTTVRIGTARLRRLTSCASRRIRVRVAGAPIRRIAFAVDGRRVRTVVGRPGRPSYTVTLPAGRGAVSRVTARVAFANGAAA